MKRLIENKLLDWKNRKDKKPLLIFGARQIGKTHTMTEFGEREYGKENVAYFYFENNLKLQEIFNKGVDNINMLVAELGAYIGTIISPEKTLIIFDEIQACNAALSSLKRFYETAPEYHIICGGSLLGLAFVREGYSFPVGKVEILNMYPMNFEEFLLEANPHLLPFIRECYENNTPMSNALHDKALAFYRTYLVIGGMPEVIKSHIAGESAVKVKAKQMSILDTYITDMGKYSSVQDANRAKAAFNSIPNQLTKENHKFQYALIKSGARAKEYEMSMEWLKSARIVLECRKTKGEVPLPMYADMLTYKIYMSDVGLLTAKSDFVANSVLTDTNLGSSAKGALTENYVAQELTAQGIPLYYWESNGKAELDFLLQGKKTAIPLEVKSAGNTRSQSLGVFVKKYKPEYSIRVSAKNFGFENGIKSIPLYAVWCIKP